MRHGLVLLLLVAVGCGEAEKRQPSRTDSGEHAATAVASTSASSASTVATSASALATAEPTSSALDYTPGPETAVAPSPSVSVGGATSVSGRLPPEVIQRIVRSRNASYRACYETGLRKNPNLQGRVEASFVIGRDGSVGSVGTGQRTDLPDGAVVSCVLKELYKLEFPKPEGGVVKVTYPLAFSPE